MWQKQINQSNQDEHLHFNYMLLLWEKFIFLQLASLLYGT